MKYIIRILLIAFSASLFASCSEQDLDMFDSATAYINFVTPTKIKEGTIDILEDTGDNVFIYSFGKETEDVKSHTYKIIVQIVGPAVDYDRPYDFTLVQDETTASESMYSIQSDKVIKKGFLTDTIYLKLNREPVLQKEWRDITLSLLPLEHFKKGMPYKQTVTLHFADMMFEPEWWSGYSYLFGSYYQEVYSQWMRIYHYGADNLKDENGNLYYWDNMPEPSGNFGPSTFPTLFLHIAKLKEYFDANDIIPYGESAPIRLPDRTN